MIDDLRRREDYGPAVRLQAHCRGIMWGFDPMGTMILQEVWWRPKRKEAISERHQMHAQREMTM